jgi:dipeptidyl aminopeptidase/acylaminoacyl peptidase
MLTQHGEDKSALRRWRMQTGRWETMHRDPATIADADAVLWSAAQEDWLAIAYHGAHRRWYGKARETSDVLAALEQQLPDANLQLTASVDRARWLVRAQRSDRAHDRYFVYTPGNNTLQPLFARDDATSRIPPRGATMHPVSYRGSDGMLLHGYVLLPNGIRAAEAPLVAWLHGGPVSRVYDEYEPTMQLLVNRGCVVFVPNFRVSSGYGKQYTRAANGDVGNGRVLADMIDGLDFLLNEGIGDRNRQAVMGMSFGGYASLLALSHHPLRFRFALAAAPPTDYGWIKQWQAEHENEALRPEGPGLSLQFPLYGFRYQDAAWRRKMQRESPLAALSALQAPAYIWAGAVDERVPLKSIVNYVGAARQLGKSVSLLIDPQAGHVPESVVGAEAYLYLVERAAQRHLGGRLTPASAELSTFLRSNLRVDVEVRPN